MADFDPLASAKRLNDLLAEKGTLIDPGAIIVPEPKAGDDTGVVVHHVSHTTYMDAGGHLHAVLLDEVVTGIQGGGAGHTVLEILSDVVVS